MAGHRNALGAGRPAQPPRTGRPGRHRPLADRIRQVAGDLDDHGHRVPPERHGIEDFVAATEHGDVAVSSSLRKVPALWNMATRGHRSVLVLGWWATWPAEAVNGVLASDRLLSRLKDRTFPPEVAQRVDELNEQYRESPGYFGEPQGRGRHRARARAPAEALRPLAGLLPRPRHHQPQVLEVLRAQGFDPIPPGEIERYGNLVPDIYRAVDRAVGDIVAAAPSKANFLVISDHGFHAAKKEDLRIFLDLESLLEHLGYLVRDEDGVDMSRTLLYPYSTQDYRLRKMVRFAKVGREEGGTVTDAQATEVRRRLDGELAPITYEGGERVFRVRDANAEEAADGADFVLVVSKDGATKMLRQDGEPLPNIVKKINRISGVHFDSPDGVFSPPDPTSGPMPTSTGSRSTPSRRRSSCSRSTGRGRLHRPSGPGAVHPRVPGSPSRAHHRELGGPRFLRARGIGDRRPARRRAPRSRVSQRLTPKATLQRSGRRADRERVKDPMRGYRTRASAGGPQKRA